MTPAQLRAALDKLDLSQLAVGRLLDVEGRTVRMWAAGDTRIPEAVAIVLRLLVAGKITLADIEAACKPRRA